ncbi:MAG: S41 family peptidase [Chitinophagales bacterium]|nr:PDZ domain-containing protein [Chitinophagales bacterium]MCO5280403.1 S41 family peptidase [Chitinophagales bacterium]HRN95505.1 S41 family peptidase [Chitinophagales bacterium]HRP38190.1 S41 family peptidase [Chitinophagales bacterium]
MMESDNNLEKKKINVWQPLIFALVLVFGILLGLLLFMVNTGKQKPFVDNQRDQFNEILTYIKLKYVDTVNTQNLYEDAVQDMLSSLDPHSVYIPAQELARENESLEGNFDGIGIEFNIFEDTIMVVTPITGGPSEAVGLKSGDLIVKINDTLVCGVKIKNEDVVRKLRGQKNTKVKVSILRKPENKILDFYIIRNTIPLYSIDAALMLNKTTGYIKINRFSATTHDEFKKKLRALQEEGMTQLIIDVRQNPGGYLNAAAEIADDLLRGEKLIVYTEGQAYKRQNYIGGREGLFEKGKLVVLIDQGSASASEILAGAVQDWDRGAIVGRTSFGKGLVQEQFPLGDGSALRLTVARYYTPSGRCIQRPYDHGKTAYNEDFLKRYEDGSLLKDDTLSHKDSLVYKTAKGRKVYGGGGIHPDYFTPFDSSILNINFAEAVGFIPEFTYKTYPEYEQQIAKYKDVQTFDAQFSVSDALFHQYLEFVKQHDPKVNMTKFEPYYPKVKQRLKAFLCRQRWQNEGYFYIMKDSDKDIKKALEVLEKDKI